MINEGLRSIIAVPVVVGGGARAVIYAALRESTPIGGRIFDMLGRAGDRLAAEITIRDEVDRRVELIDTLVDGGQAPTTTELTEGIREIHTELRALTRTAPDSAFATSLQGLADTLAGLSRGDVPRHRFGGGQCGVDRHLCRVADAFFGFAGRVGSGRGRGPEHLGQPFEGVLGGGAADRVVEESAEGVGEVVGFGCDEHAVGGVGVLVL
nr:hypothetical protein [Rhodococcus wratislaviensis]